LSKRATATRNSQTDSGGGAIVNSSIYSTSTVKGGEMAKWNIKPNSVNPDDSNADSRGYILTAQVSRLAKLVVELHHQFTDESQREYVDSLIRSDVASAVKAEIIADDSESAIWAVLDSTHRDNVRKVFPKWEPEPPTAE